MRFWLVTFVIALIPFGSASLAMNGAETRLPNPESECERWLAGFEGLVGQQPKMVVTRESAKADGRTFYEANGVPLKAKWTTLSGTEVFRHYVGKEEILQTILSTSELRAGNRPYVSGDRHTMIHWKDLTGIFVTTTSHSSGDVDAASHFYVDFTLPKGTKLLEIVDGILLLPGPPSTATWLEAEYEKWKKDPNSVDKLVRGQMEKMDREGVRVPRRQKITIVDHN